MKKAKARNRQECLKKRAERRAKFNHIYELACSIFSEEDYKRLTGKCKFEANPICGGDK